MNESVFIWCKLLSGRSNKLFFGNRRKLNKAHIAFRLPYERVLQLGLLLVANKYMPQLLNMDLISIFL